MCGIFGCISDEAADKVLTGLRKLEYRGYDSAGLAALFSGQKGGPVKTERTIGHVSDLVSKANGRFSGSSISIGHTRWATHGRVSDINAHPHSSSDGTIAMVHNGIIENASELLESVIKLGYEVKSETDSELVVHLLDHELKTQPEDNSILDAFQSTIRKLRGSWAIAIVISGLDGILIARNGAPLIVGRGNNSTFVSSDIQPLLHSCSEVAYLDEGDVFLLNSKGLICPDGIQEPPFEEISGVPYEPTLGPYPHMMLKEIHDQPVSLSNVLSGRLFPDGRKPKLDLSLSSNEIKQLERINIVACGTAFIAAQVGVHYLRKYTGIFSEAFRASEFPSELVCNSNTLTIAISQSGETKDSLDAIQNAKISGSHVSSFCNVIGSTLARFTKNGVYLHAGPEFAVASTKVFTNMLASTLLFALSISEIKDHEMRGFSREIRRLPKMISQELMQSGGAIESALEFLDEKSKPIFIGRGISSIIADEGALKMMEECYIPCVSYPGGELKHGPIALIEEGTPVIAIAPTDSSINSMESTIRECKARGAAVILITDNEGPICNIADSIIPIPTTHPDLSPFVTTLPLQLLAYHLAVKLELDVDKPRNLAKSVTVK